MLYFLNIQKILYFSFLLSNISTLSVFAQEVHRAASTYRSSISLSEPRISDIKESLSSESPNFPNSLKLFFQELKGNYAIFYDWNGETVYYKYRINKFDKSKLRQVRKLSEGAAYEINGRWEGLIVFQVSTVPLFKKASEISLEEKKINSPFRFLILLNLRNWLWMKSFIKKKIQNNFLKEVSSFLIFLSSFIFPSSFDLLALDPLNPDLSYHLTPFILNIVKIRLPEKAEVLKLGTGNHWKIIPTQGKAWMLILREWDGLPSNEESLKSILKDLFPNSFLKLPNLKMIGGERKETVYGTPLTIRYFLLEKIKKSYRSIFVLIQKIKPFLIFFKIRINF
ncbi:hypothetical protein LEP1GSC170_4585 [Leptospira interrogans serovar Bataviae str. HAI135]|nr:hypothetical protein LEP1GSC170_4585 [Leptospira interrogans serovar Bataviae str. HAI135]